MRKLIFLLLLCSFSLMAKEAPHIKSIRLQEVIEDLKAEYADPTLKSDIAKLNQVNNLSYFIRFIDADGTPEQANLKAYLFGLQTEYSLGIRIQSELGSVPWFCPKMGWNVESFSNHEGATSYIENMIWRGLERDIASNNPQGIDKENWYKGRNLGYFHAYDKVQVYADYGLITRFPCFDEIHDAVKTEGLLYGKFDLSSNNRAKKIKIEPWQPPAKTFYQDKYERMLKSQKQHPTPAKANFLEYLKLEAEKEKARNAAEAKRNRG